MTTRRVLTFTAPHTIALVAESLPPLAADHVRVQTLVSAISAGTELLIYRGEQPQTLAADATIAALAGDLRYPLAYGYCAVGTVIASGSAVADGWRGRRVFAFQPHATLFDAPPAALLALPDDLPPAVGALLPNMETAVSFVMDGRPVIGERVAVFGQGIVGLLTTRLLALLPLAELIAVDAHARRRAAARDLGATRVLAAGAAEAAAAEAAAAEAAAAEAAAAEAAAAEAAAAEAAAAEAADCDLVYELSGNPDALDAAIAAAGYGGRVVIGSWYGTKPATLHLGGDFHRKQLTLIGSQVSTLAAHWRARWDKPRRLQTALALLLRLQPDGLITHRIPFARAAEAYDLLATRPGEALQVVLTYGADD